MAIQKEAMEINTLKNNAMQEQSDHVVINSRLVSFLYDLMRDHMPPGKIESLVRAAEDEPLVTYTNGWLANYAKYLAERLNDNEDSR